MDFILNAIHWNIDQEIFKIGSFGIRYYSLCWLLAFAISYILMLKVFKRESKTQEDLDKLSIYIFLGILIGARVGHCLFYEFDTYITKPWMMFLPFQIDASGTWHFTGFQGLASHGAVAGTLIALYLYSKKTKTDFIWIADRLVLVVPIAGAFVRLGNFFNSEIIGKPADPNLPWAVIFENAGLIPASLNMVPRHPAQLYEAAGYVILFFVLWTMYQKNKTIKPGLLFGLFFAVLFTIRFVMEFFKENQEDFEAGMLFNMGQLLSIPLIILGLYFIFRNPKENTLKK